MILREVLVPYLGVDKTKEIAEGWDSRFVKEALIGAHVEAETQARKREQMNTAQERKKAINLWEEIRLCLRADCENDEWILKTIQDFSRAIHNQAIDCSIKSITNVYSTDPLPRTKYALVQIIIKALKSLEKKP